MAQALRHHKLQPSYFTSCAVHTSSALVCLTPCAALLLFPAVLARAAARILALVEAHDEGLKTKQQLEEARTCVRRSCSAEG